MSRQATSAPSRARRSAVARPMPRRRAAPVTSAILPPMPDRAMRRASIRAVPGQQIRRSPWTGGRDPACDRRASMLARPILLALAVLAAAPPLAEAKRSYTVKVPTFEVPAGKNREICVFVPIRSKDPLDLGEIRIANRIADHGKSGVFATHHLIVYAYHGPLDAVTAGEVKDDTACLNFGRGRPSDLSIVATSQGVNSRWVTPTGTALKLAPETDPAGKPVVGLVLNSHWINGDSKPRRARAKVTLITRKSKEVVRELKPIFEVVANGFIDVPPGQVRKVGWDWGPGRLNLGGFLGGSGYPEGNGACVTMLIGHTHKRGTLFTADLVDTAGNRSRLYEQTDYADPRARLYSPPIYITSGQRIAYECTHDNAAHPRLGCEEQPGVAPGESVLDAVAKSRSLANPSGAAKLCTTEGPNPTECPPTDPAYPDHTYTGNCVQANLVFGFTSEDDMCILPGYYYDPNPDAAPGQECTL